jgi:hypothetical protein
MSTTNKLSHNPFDILPSVFASKGAITMISAQLRSYEVFINNVFRKQKLPLFYIPQYAKLGQIFSSIPTINLFKYIIHLIQ